MRTITLDFGRRPASVYWSPQFLAEIAVRHRPTVLLLVRRRDEHDGPFDADVFVRGRFGLRAQADAHALFQQFAFARRRPGQKPQVATGL